MPKSSETHPNLTPAKKQEEWKTAEILNEDKLAKILRGYSEYEIRKGRGGLYWALHNCGKLVWGRGVEHLRDRIHEHSATECVDSPNQRRIRDHVRDYV